MTHHRIRLSRCLLSVLLILPITGVTAQSQSDGDLVKRQFKLFGGAGFPVGDFAATTSAEAGLAQTGLTLGTEFFSEVVRHFELGLGVMFNLHSLDGEELQRQFRTVLPNATVEAGSWDLFWFMGGAGFNAPLGGITDIYGRGNIGMLVGISPGLTLRNGSSQAQASSATGTAIAYGVGLGIVVDAKYDIGIRYLYGEPEYEITVRSGSNSATSKGKQPTSVVQMTVGYVFR